MVDRVFLRQSLIKHEGRRKKVYTDSKGILSIGVGRNLENNGLSDVEIDFLLDNDIDRCIDSLNKNLYWWATLDDNTQLVLVEMCFQLGISGLLDFKKFLSYLQVEDRKAAVEEMFNSKWEKQCPSRVRDLARLIEQPVEL